MTAGRPPRLAEWLLEWALDGDAFEAIAGDLEEEFRRDSIRHCRRARRRYRRLALQSVLACWWRRARRRPAVRGEAMLTTVARDLGYAIRMLRRQPSFAAVLIFTLSLGIGGTTAIFSIFEAVLLRPLPYADEERIVMVWETEPAEGVEKKVGTPGNFQDWRTANTTLDYLSGVAEYGATMTGQGDPVRVEGRRVSAGVFTALGVVPMLGRPFAVEDEQSGHDVVILAHHLWQQHFGGDPSIVGRRVTVNDVPRTVVGVMGPDFRLPRGHDDLLIPLIFSAWERQARGSHWLMAIGRLKPGVSLAEAQADMNVIATRLAADYPRWNAREGLLVEPIREEMVGDLRRPVLVLMGAVLLVLAIACINAANLLLARAAARHQEMAVRLALGAGRTRLVRQLLTESVLAALLGAAGGGVLAWLGVFGLAAVLPESLAQVRDVSINASVLLFAGAAAIVTGTLFGLAPALQLSGRRPATALQDETRTSTSRGVARTGRMLVAIELALALVLLVGAGLFIQSFARLTRVETGFQAESVLTFRIDLPRSRYANPAAWSPFFDELMARLGAEPGVEAAGAISWLPLTTSGGSNALFVEGWPLPGPGEESYVVYRLVTRDYFKALRIPLIAGRTFDSTDGPRTGLVVVINETMARRYWPGESPLGKRVSFMRQPVAPRDWMTVVGVVGDTKQGSLAEPIDIEMFAPDTQEANWFPPSHVAVRTAGDPLSVAEAARRHVHDLDPLMPVADVQTLDRVVSANAAPSRFNTILIGAFSGMALALAAVGVYGLLSLSVALRQREIAVRTALGAAPSEIARLILKEGLVLATAGIAIGLVAAAALGRGVEALLYDTRPSDPTTAALTAALLLAVALVACYLPARRAARLDPVVAMRN